MVDLVKQDMTHLWAQTGDIVAPDDTKIDTGWAVETVPRQWWNWMQNRVDTNVAYALQKGIPEWDAGTEYIINKSYVQHLDVLYKCIQTGIGFNPSTEPLYWKKALVESTASMEALKAVTPAADRLAYFTSGTTATVTPITAFARSILDDATAGAVLTTIGAQPVDATLTALAGVSTTTNSLLYFTGVDTAASTPFSAYGRQLIDDANAAAARATLELGTSATINAVSTNTSGTVVQRDGSGNFSAGTITADLTGNATTATTLQTPRTINGVSFSGANNITIVDATKLPLTGGTVAKVGQIGWSTAALKVNSTGVTGDNAVIGFGTAGTGAAIVHDDGVNGLRIETTSAGTLANLQAAVVTATTVNGDGSGLTALNASQLTSGVVPDARLAGNYTNLGSITQTGTTVINGMVAGTKTWLVVNNGDGFSIREDNVSGSRLTIASGGAISGNGSGLNTLNAANLSSGIVPDARLSGTYTGVSITGNAATATLAASATALATARTINGVSFNGTANITVADATKIPLTGGSLGDGAILAFSKGTAVQYVSHQWRKAGTIRAAMGNEPNGSWNVWTYTAGGSFSASLNFADTGVLTAPFFAGNGASITNITANNLATGTVPLARLPGDVQNLAVGLATQDPDIATSPVILSNHANTPGLGVYWHITTTFYSAIGAGANRGQIAVSYNGASAQCFVRHCFASVWTDWVRCDNSDTDTAGLVSSFARSSAPSGWLKANGAAVSRTTYAALFAAIGTTFGAGNGSTTFNLPDMRGEFVRGWDDARGVDSGRAFGSFQDSDNKSHTHTASTGSDAHTHTWSGTTSATNTSYLSQARQLAGSASTVAVPISGESSTGVTVDGNSISGAYGVRFTNSLNAHTHTTSGTTSSDAHTHTVTVNAAGLAEARPRNVALLYCIKY